MVEELPEGYYLDNFQYLIGFVQNRYDDILNDEERGFLASFESLPINAQKALVRLLGRTHLHIREDKCHYQEIDDFSGAIELLVAAGLVRRNSLEDPLSWLSLATRPELESAFPEVYETHKKAKLKKDELCDVIAQEATLDEIIQRLDFVLLEATCRPVLDRLKLLFFGNLHQDFTDFVLHELGVVPFETYSLDAAGRYFNRRILLDEMLEVYELQAVSEQVLADPELCLSEFANHYLVQEQTDQQDPKVTRRYHKIFNRVARQLERENEPALALQLYEQSNLTPSRERRARILVTEGKIEEALEVCLEITQEPHSEEELEFAAGFSFRTAKKHLDSLPSWIEPKHKDEFEIEYLELEKRDGEGVEQAVVHFYRSQLAWSEHVENGLLPGLFGLLFWDVIFAPIPGVFFHPFQRGPADLFNREFMAERASLIQQRLGLIQQSEAFKTELLKTFEVKQGLANHFVMWRHISKELIDLAVERIPAQHLLAVFERMLRDLKSNRSGFPDLVVFPEGGGYELVEVKGPGDTLQGNQKRWLRSFKRFGIPAKVVHVSWLT